MPDARLERPLIIEGMGRYLPKRIVDNALLSEMAERDYRSIDQQCGVLTRRFANREAGETAPMMGARAAEAALRDAGCTINDVDMIIGASGTSHQFIPDQSVFIQKELGAGSSGITCFSVHTSCLSFLTALDIAGSHLASGRCERVLIVSSEFASAGLNLRDPESGPLFGDAAAAAVVRLRREKDELSPMAALHRVNFETYGDDAHLTGVPGSGTNLPANDPRTSPEQSFFRMNGVGLLKRACRVLPPFLASFAPELATDERNDITFVLHQASKAGFNLVTRLGFPEDQVIRTLSEYGNCVAASLPLTLMKAIETKRLKRGGRCMMLGTAAGVSYGGAYFTY